MKKILILSITLFSSVNAMEISGDNLVVSSGQCDVGLFHDDSGFHVVKDGVTYDVKSSNVDKPIREESDEELNNFMGVKDAEAIDVSDINFEGEKPEKHPEGFLIVEETSENNFKVHAQTRVATKEENE